MPDDVILNKSAVIERQGDFIAFTRRIATDAEKPSVN